MFGFFRNLFKKKEQIVRKKMNGMRIMELEPGDSCLILKENGTSIIVDSGNPQLTKADEIIAMVWCYLANPEFVNILETMFSDIVDEINSDKMRNNLTVGRSGVYAKENKNE